MLRPFEVPQPVLLRNALWRILDRIDHNAAKPEQTSDLKSLLETIRSYQPVSPAVIWLVQVASEACIDSTDLFTSSRAVDAFNELNAWLSKLDLPAIDHFLQTQEPETRPDASLNITQSFASLLPLPLTWPEFVFEIRTRLQAEQGPLPPFSKWTLPQHRWSSRWIDAFAVIAAVDEDLSTGYVVIPSDDATTSTEAEECWRMRMKAANYLQKTPVSPRIARALVHSRDGASCGISLLRSDATRRTLTDRLDGGCDLSPRECVEMGISLCGILGELNAHGIHIMDISPSWIAFEWEPGQRFTQLLDPTAVIPGLGLLPEWRECEVGLANAVEMMNPEVSQVFLIGTLVLAVLCGTVDDLILSRFPAGRAATFATLTGSPQLADSHINVIADTFVAELNRKAISHNEMINSSAIVEVLKWSVAERPADRYSNLMDLASAMRQSLR